MQQLTVTIPIPPRDCNPNGRCHWAKKARAVKRARQDAMLCALEASGSARPGWPSVSLTVRWFGRDHRCLNLDPDNIVATIKSSLDGLTDAGIWTDDRGVRIGRVEIEVDRDRPRVELVVEPISANPVKTRPVA